MFSDASFWATLLVAAAVCQLLPPSRQRERAAVLALASVVVLWSVVGVSWIQLGVLAGCIAWLLAGAGRIAGSRHSRPVRASLVLCAPMLLLWIASKQLAAARSPEARILIFLGVSYVMIKAYTLAKDVADGRIARVDPVVASAYFLFFPTYVAGPMHYYGEFDATLREPDRLSGEALLDVVFRFLLGMLKARIVAPLLKPMSLGALTDAAVLPAGTLAFASLIFSLQLLLDFSGYSDMAIATARLLGVRTPENFAWPYAAASIREFWQRWHITFSRVLTGYVFIPLTRALQKPLAGRRAAIAGGGYFVTFLLCGYWHGAAPNFLAWGLYHAAGLFAYDRYRARRAGSPRSAAVRATAGTRVARAIAVAVTFIFVSLGWIFFALPLGHLARIVP
ncbi:MAG: hypothetical protein M3081_16935 [Gemmatimonadota bacterium]|nr:hypothetical protein [Gemmatimonadota bacterium]